MSLTLADLAAEVARLSDRVTRQDVVIEKQDARIEKQDAEIARQGSLIMQQDSLIEELTAWAEESDARQHRCAEWRKDQETAFAVAAAADPRTRSHSVPRSRPVAARPSRPRPRHLSVVGAS